VSSVVSDLLGVSARRMLQALADGETDPAALATLAAPRLRATPEQLCDAFQASATLHPVYRRLLALTLEELRLIQDHLGQLDQQMADLLTPHHDAVQRLAEVPGLGVDSAQQIIAEVGAITHRRCRLIWKILHQRIRYEERGPAVSVQAKKVRTRKMIRELRRQTD
jgi:transposase